MKVKKILSIQAAPQSCPEATVRLPSSCSVQAQVSVPTLSLSSYLPALRLTFTSFSASLSSASFSLTLWTNICLISSSFFWSSPRNSFLFASYVSCKL